MMPSSLESRFPKVAQRGGGQARPKTVPRCDGGVGAGNADIAACRHQRAKVTRIADRPIARPAGIYFSKTSRNFTRRRELSIANGPGPSRASVSKATMYS
jgi:hypothetical protein